MIAQRPLSFAALFGAVLALSACSPKAEEQSTQVAASSDGSAAVSSGSIKLLNVSYDVARDFYKEYNPLFIKAYQAQNPGAEISIQQSHGGSSKQALAVANGLQADVATMNQTSDIELLEKKGLVKAEWRTRLPDNAVPFTGTTVFLVRKGNPKQIRDWADLAKDNLQIVLANPKTSGNGRYAFLGAFGYALKTNNGDEAKAKEFTGKLLKNTPVLENGGRAATTTFTQRNIGDVLVTFENEANHVSRNLAPGQFEIVYPSYTILSESPVAVVDSVAGKKGSQAAAEEYLKYLWSEPAQELAAKFYMRPSNPAVLAKHKSEFPEMETFSPNQVFGSWEEIMKKYFADGGLFDRLAQKQ
ncbi:sulfate ABC transporter substrate-binding protein [Neisseria sp. Dent CA1/247]|uniref:sulfate ABC transporter substrate-binding protein n=1 Tax=Neisseria sp. Dent CA1/247 TaxID=2912675 RepID=UPI001FD2064A|nr:sulfate ABC transporter substrate-binding protein [Neisseria sp. Dent CA1/247]UOO78210.1 sulfate ABC transporter substrate-binding protein [Neisseria sp. Dent CA1/247]